jgi:hypothetical protein
MFRTIFWAALLLSAGLELTIADSQIPLTYVPKKVRAAIQEYVPGAQLTEARIGSDDSWGTKYSCEYFRAGHKGRIELAESGHLLDVDEDLVLTEVPALIRRVAAREARGGAMRKASIEMDAGTLVYKTESFYGLTDTKVKLKITRSGEVIARDFD